MIFLIIGGTLFYLACSVLAYRATFAYFQTEYASINSPAHRQQDRALALGMAMIGPIGLVGCFIHHDFKHGFSVRD